MMSKIYPRKGDTQTVYLNAVVKEYSAYRYILVWMCKFHETWS